MIAPGFSFRNFHRSAVAIGDKGFESGPTHGKIKRHASCLERSFSDGILRRYYFKRPLLENTADVFDNPTAVRAPSVRLCRITVVRLHVLYTAVSYTAFRLGRIRAMIRTRGFTKLSGNFEKQSVRAGTVPGLRSALSRDKAL